jgi:hypothetical protein
MTLPNVLRSADTPSSSCAPASDPEAGDDLVEDEQGADAVALGPRPSRNPAPGDQAHVGGDRFEDDRATVSSSSGTTL